MDRQEAAGIAEKVSAELRNLPYASLVTRLLSEVETRTVTAPSGIEYQVEVQAMWDGGQPGDLRVLVGVDDGRTDRWWVRADTRLPCSRDRARNRPGNGDMRLRRG